MTARARAGLLLSLAATIWVAEAAAADPPPKIDASPTLETKAELEDTVDTSKLAKLPDQPTAPVDSKALVTGADKSGVSSQVLSLPKGAGKIGGEGESFSAQLSTGIGTYAVPLALPSGRGSVSPSLGLSYSSSAGHGLAGVGWDVGVPFIARATDKGIPAYNDPPVGGAWTPQQDHFVFNGGQDLVPICLVSASLACAGALPTEVMPSWAAGYQYFRPRIEGGFERFFWSPDHRTWIVQDKTGAMMELGVPLDGSGYDGALETHPTDTSKVYRWNLARQRDLYADSNGQALNTVVYRYLHDGEMAYVSDIFVTSPVGQPQAPLSAWAHHVRLVWETRTDASTSFRRGWAATQSFRLSRVDVSSHTMQPSGGRRQVRRVHLAYDPAYHVSLLTSAQVEGRCSGEELSAPQEDSAQHLPETTSCQRLPAMTFDYGHVDAEKADGTPAGATLAGYEPFDERVHTLKGSPAFSIDDGRTTFMDVDSDGLPDVLVTDPAAFNGAHGVFFQGRDGVADKLSSDTLAVVGLNGENATTLRLSNPNVSLQDLDGDGFVDLLHMPKASTYTIYGPKFVGGAWQWAGRKTTTANGLSPALDLQKHQGELRVLDANGDGLVDVVITQGTAIETHLALGRFPGGDGLFGSAQWTGADTAVLTSEPIRRCVPWAGAPVRFSDSDVRLGDVNGDGLPDIVRIRPGEIKYWPGRGDGVWGTGDPADCKDGTFGQDTWLEMADGPWSFDTPGLRLDDVNGDGLDDLVEVRFQEVDVWLNIDGHAFTDRHILKNTPVASSLTNRVRLLDVNGSGTRDLVWGDGNEYKYIDLSAGSRPWLLTKVANGLGKTTEITYRSSVDLMLDARAAGKPWATTTPMPLEVVTAVTEKDNLPVAGRPGNVHVTTYTYRDPLFEGRQREFRGFKDVSVRREGDANSPAATTRSVFLLGECLPVDAPDCQPASRWKDNPRESLKGLPVFSEISDDAGVFLETNHHTYLYRVLYNGLDGRRVVHASERQSDHWRYDTGPFKPQTKTLWLTEVEGEGLQSFKLRAVAGTTHERSLTEVDLFGNRTKTIDEGCVDGCPSVDEVISTTFVADRVGGDQTGWLWRTVETWIEGDQHPGVQRKKTLTTYDGSGNPLTTVASLSGTLPLQRSHAAGGAVAPPPAGASQDGAILLVAQVHDVYGNVIAERGAGNRCRRMTYDTAFADLAVTERVYVGALDNAAEPCGQQELVASAQVDRGYGAARRLTDLHGEVSQVDFDGLGRPVAAWKPSATTVGALSPRPSALYEYDLPADPVARPYAVVRTQTQNGVSDADDSYQEAWAIVDGFGRALVTLQQADPDVDGHGWVVNGHTEYDAKGAARRVFLAWFWDGDPSQFPLGVAPATQSTRTRYDAFGRIIQTFGLDNSQASKNVYHALSQDMWDAGDLSPGPYQGTFASTRADGHGRTVENTERVHGADGKLELRTVETKYLPSGPVEKITRRRLGKPDVPVVRWMQHDTLDRMVLNVEQSTSTNFVSDPTLATDALRAWRYAFDDAGELVGTSDARGCGVNTAYDAGGRLISEDYSPCEAQHAVYDAASDVVYHYDTPDVDAPAPAVFAVDAALLQGRLVSVRDRASHVLTRYDGRGRVTGLAKRLASPNPGPVAYVGPWQSQIVTFDGADRPVRESTGARAAPHLDNQGESWVETQYTKRGSVREVVSSYGLLASRVEHDADGLVMRVVHGDVANTETVYGYDEKRRLRSVQTYRGPPGIWTAPPPGYSPQYGTSDAQSFPLLLEDLEYRYDAADNPVEIHDYRLPEEWRAGAKPVSRRMQYDDNYRLTNVEYQYANGDDTWKSPWAYENQPQEGHFPKANPQPTLSYTKRPQWQRYAYDWLGNRASSDDDARGFYDRSLGNESHTGPYQLTGAGNRATAVAQPREGILAAKYDAAGNLTALTVVRNGAGVCERGATCSAKFAYRYDELGRLATARRWDLAADSSEQTGFNPALDEPTTTPAVELTYAYDATDQRVRKSVKRGGATEHTLYIFAALELRKVDDASVQSSGVYTQDVSTERVYLLAHGVRMARIAVETGGALPSTGSGVHVFLELSDHLGSAALVLDRDTSELVEHRTYQPFGGVESDERADRWAGFREEYGFTGKEEDEEVGLSYFGKRYLSVGLGRWTTADPLAVHVPGGADLNLYAYVGGRVFVAVDPIGLDGFLKRARNEAKYASRFMAGLAVGTVKVFGNTVNEAMKDSPAVHIAQIPSAISRGDAGEAVRHLAMATPLVNMTVTGVKGTVGTASSLAALPSQVHEVVNTPDEYASGEKSAQPVVTIALTGGVLLDVAVALRAPEPGPSPVTPKAGVAAEAGVDSAPNPVGVGAAPDPAPTGAKPSTGIASPMSPSKYPNPDPPMSEPPVRYEPRSVEEILRMRAGKGPTTKSTHGNQNIEAHHRQQVPIEEGGVMDELTMETHRGAGNHSRHSQPSRLTPAQRAKEIRDHWQKRGREYKLPGEDL